jgi:HEAT repeat protein
MSAIHYLQNFDNETIVIPISSMLDDEYWAVRKKAAQSLSTIGNQQAVPPLIEAIKVEKESDIKVAMVRTLGDIDNGSSADLLIQLLQDRSEFLNVRETAVVSLGEIGNEKAVDPLIQILLDKDEPWEIRSKAAYSLGVIGNEKAVDPLSQVSQDSNEYLALRTSAEEALGKIKDDR